MFFDLHTQHCPGSASVFLPNLTSLTRRSSVLLDPPSASLKIFALLGFLYSPSMPNSRTSRRSSIGFFQNAHHFVIQGGQFTNNFNSVRGTPSIQTLYLFLYWTDGSLIAYPSGQERVPDPAGSCCASSIP